MSDLVDILRQYGKEKKLSQGEVLIRQGEASDGAYYLEWGKLGAYREERDASYLLSEIVPGNLVGELGAATGWSRSATVKAEVESCVIQVSEDDFHQIMNEAPALAARIVRQLGERLTHADTVRVTLGRSYRQAADRVQTLRTQKAQLEELLRLREELSSMLVHDLRNPLGVISASLELLARALSDDGGLVDVDAVLDTTGRAARRMQRLVDTLLDITRLEEGELTLRLLPLDLNSMVEEVLAEERALAGHKGLVLENLVPLDLPRVLGDRDIVQRVLINLLDNSIKFTPSGGRVWVEAHSDADGVRVEVVDTGPGIPLEEKERIFEKFTQVQGRTGSRRGSGLGLAFCRMATEVHGGGIWVEDGPEEKGSRFIFVLPCT